MKNYVFTLFTALLMCVGATTVASAQSESPDLYTKLQQAMSQNLWDDVLLISSDLLVENPTSGDGYYYSALAFYRLGDVEKAREYLALTSDFDDEEFQSRVKELADEINYNENLEQAASQIGSIQQTGNAAVAADEWRDLWKSDKTQVDFALNAVQLYVQQKRYLEALEILGDPTLRTVPEANQAVRAINATPEMIAYYTYTNAMRDGTAAMQSGEFQQAIGQFNTALRVRANDPDASRLKAQAEDELAWINASNEHSIASYDAYLAGNTNKKYASDARSLIRDGLIFHGLNAAQSNNVQLAEANLNRYLSDYPGDAQVGEARSSLCSMYTRLGDQNAGLKTVGAQSSAVSFYTKAESVCADRGGLGMKKASANRKMVNWSRPSQAYMSFTYDDISTYGLSIGNLHTRGAGFYFTARLNEALINNYDPYTVDDQGNLDGASNTYTYRDTGARRTMNAEGLIGFTYEIAYPLWMYAGAGMAYNAEQWEIDEFLRGSLETTEWIRNTDQTKYEPVFEAGVILNISGIHLRVGAKGYDAERVYYTVGAGFSF